MSAELQQYPSDSHRAAVMETVRLAESYPDAKAYVVVDVDDVINKTQGYMDREFRRELRRTHPGLQRLGLRLPRRRTVKELGLRAAYAPLLGGDEEYVALFHQIEHRPDYLNRLPLVDPRLSRRLQALADAGYPVILGLSARSEELMEATRERLEALGIHMPVYTHYPVNRDVVGMKKGVLRELAEALPGKQLIMLDDNAGFISELNTMGDPLIIGVQFSHRWGFVPRGSLQPQTNWQRAQKVLGSVR